MNVRLYLAIGFTAANLSGCSLAGLLGFGEEEEPVGPTTKVALSLYAGPNVNPNPNIPQAEIDITVPPTADASLIVDSSGQALYQISLSGTDQLDLIDRLNVLLDHLQSSELANAATQEAAAQEAADLSLDSEQQIPPSADTTIAQQVSSAAEIAAEQQVPLVADTAAAPPLPAASDLDDIPQTLHTLDDQASLALEEAQSDIQFGVWQHAGGNPDSQGAAAKAVATPVTFKILQLKDDSLFLNADLEQLSNDLEEALGSTYLSDDDYILLPGQFKFIDYADIDEDTRYIAVFANFHDPHGAIWKQVLRLEPNGHRYALLVTLNDNVVAITEERYRQPKPRVTE